MGLPPNHPAVKAAAAKGILAPGKRAKFGNVKTQVDGLTFDSAKEARRYGELKALERAGLVTDLRLQVRYPLAVNGVEVCAYVADFVYAEGGVTVVEDVKSAFTRKNPVYRIKCKLMRAVHGIAIREV